MTKQETFDLVVAHARKQGRKAYDEAQDMCLYRGPEGTKCFVGALIPDKYYSSGMEGGGCLAETPSRVGDLMKSLGHDVALLNACQDIHDDFEPEVWEGMFEQLADSQGLVYYVPKGN